MSSIGDMWNWENNRDRNLAGVVQRDIDELMAALATYEIVGLSIVRRAAEVHDVTIEIGDAPGGGSVFTIAFPHQQAETGY